MPGTNGHAVHDAPEVHIQGALPILDVAQHAAAHAGRGTVHEKADLAEPGVDRLPERHDLIPS
jgi:hypothetical protein